MIAGTLCVCVCVTSIANATNLFVLSCPAGDGWHLPPQGRGFVYLIQIENHPSPEKKEKEKGEDFLKKCEKFICLFFFFFSRCQGACCSPPPYISKKDGAGYLKKEKKEKQCLDEFRVGITVCSSKYWPVTF